MPSIDVCFTEDDMEFAKDTYIFKSIKAASEVATYN